MYRGDIRLGNTIDIKFVTTAVATGAPTQLAGSPVISAYVGNGTTQITAGITLTVDFDGVTGLNNVRVVATSGNGFATATDVQLVITTGTVGGTSVVGYVVAEFSIENRSALMPTTAARTLDVSAGGEAGLDWANIGSPTTAVNLSATNIDVDQVVASVSGAVASVTAGVTLANNAITAAATAADFTTEIQTGLATAAALAVVDGIVDDILVDTGTTLPATLATIAGYIDTEIGTLQTSVNDLPTNAELTTALADLPTNAELATALETADDAVLAAVATVDTVVDAIKVKTDQLTFTKANELDSNLQSVNGVTVNGDGAGTPMGV